MTHTSTNEYDSYDAIYQGDYWSGLAKYQFDGTMDELRFYNRALSSDDACGLYLLDKP